MSRTWRQCALIFFPVKPAYRRKYGHAGGEAISKAVGIKKGHRPNVVDATAGLGSDAFVLATMGCRVHMIERSDVIAKLLEDGLRRAEQDKKIGTLIKEKLSLTCGDSRQELLQVPFEPEVIYLDPMFPQKEKSALVKKEMRMLQEVVGQDTDADELLNRVDHCHTTCSRQTPGLCEVSGGDHTAHLDQNQKTPL